MKRPATIFSLLLCLILIIPTVSFGQYVVGNTVSNFTLNDVEGNSCSLYDYMGEVVLLNFYTTW
jgi:cytochrome oxidase Cu insertion factor (SCO1/SenC/PrrC family)